DQSVVSSLHCMNDPQPEGHMASHIERRKFLATLGGAGAVWSLAANAQQGARMRRVGVLMSTAADDPEGQARIAAFAQGLQQTAWVVGDNVRVDIPCSRKLGRSAIVAGNPDRALARTMPTCVNTQVS